MGKERRGKRAGILVSVRSSGRTAAMDGRADGLTGREGERSIALLASCSPLSLLHQGGDDDEGGGDGGSGRRRRRRSDTILGNFVCFGLWREER